MEAELVTKLDEVIENVKQFNKDLAAGEDVISQLTMFKHWYYLEELDLFGPSKYVGYKNMNTSRYDRGKGKTGVDTEAVLKQWFRKLENGSEEEQKLMVKLMNLVEGYHKRVRSNAFVHVLK
ncbi:hypothetical protein [Calidifontibacillus oryziterrae]|uniref:hypothetical protein n=1 Tax=Calidifontibacillus oryziterrae TaxID=1191699 RepID=UPI000302AE63|nr:hypothetical protein [Calidifontibacillus oryziterrae]